MTFIGYTPWDFLGTLIGVGLMEKIVNALLHGLILAPILAIFVFLSLAKISIDTIIEHKYERALIDFAHLILVILFFTVTGSVTVINMAITNMGLAAQANKNGESFLQKLGNSIPGMTKYETNTSQNSATVSNVPLMTAFFSFPDSVAYQLTSVMLNPSTQSVNTLDYDNILLNPQQLIYTGFAGMFYGTSNPMEVYAEAKYCLEGSIGDKVVNLFKWIMPGLKSIDCNAFYNNWANSMQNVYNQLQSKGNLPPNTAKLMQKEILLAQNGFGGDKSLVQPIIEQINKLDPLVNKIADSYSTTNNATTCGAGGSYAQSATCSVQTLVNQFTPAIRELIDGVAQVASNALSLRGMLEKFMYQLQEYAIAIMFVLLPFVVILSLLPIFGRNYKLLATYMVSFFLIKLWVPVYWLIYTAMVNVAPLMLAEAHHIYDGIQYGIQYALSTFTGDIAYASTSVGGANFGQLSAALEATKLAQKIGDYNEIILETMCILIPAVFGGGATFLIGKELMHAGALAAAEGAAITKSLIKTGMQLAAGGKLPTGGGGGGGKTPPSGGDSNLPVLPGGGGGDRTYINGNKGNIFREIKDKYTPLRSGDPVVKDKKLDSMEGYDRALMIDRKENKGYFFVKNKDGQFVSNGQYVDNKTGKVGNVDPNSVSFSRKRQHYLFTSDGQYMGESQYDGTYKPHAKKED